MPRLQGRGVLILILILILIAPADPRLRSRLGLRGPGGNGARQTVNFFGPNCPGLGHSETVFSHAAQAVRRWSRGVGAGSEQAVPRALFVKMAVAASFLDL